MSSHSLADGKFLYDKMFLNRNLNGTQHYHDFFEIYLLESGPCHYFIDNDSYDVDEE